MGFNPKNTLDNMLGYIAERVVIHNKFYRYDRKIDDLRGELGIAEPLIAEPLVPYERGICYAVDSIYSVMEKAMKKAIPKHFERVHSAFTS